MRAARVGERRPHTPSLAASEHAVVFHPSVSFCMLFLPPGCIFSLTEPSSPSGWRTGLLVEPVAAPSWQPRRLPFPVGESDCGGGHHPAVVLVTGVALGLRCSPLNTGLLLLTVVPSGVQRVPTRKEAQQAGGRPGAGRRPPCWRVCRVAGRGHRRKACLWGTRSWRWACPVCKELVGKCW